MANDSIRNEVKAAGVRWWQIADILGIADSTLSVWLRHELTPDKAEAVRAAIRRLKGEVSE
ncbi:MAG: helix-turn-helix domain-containing protein [Oscillospiraceae bacterium]|nr:helix-turn-helix domain-containing protein [Oscillospiraceae bacterium]